MMRANLTCLNVLILPILAIHPAIPTSSGSAPTAWSYATSNRTSQTLVGSLGDPSKLSFVGMQTFTEDEIRSGLTRNIDFYFVSHPDLPLSGYLQWLNEKIRSGYRCKGYIDVQVAISVSNFGSRIMIGVSEGEQYTCGNVNAVAPTTVPTEGIVQQLAETWPSEDTLSMLPSTIEKLKTPKPRSFPGVDTLLYDSHKEQIKTDCFTFFSSTGNKRQPRTPIWQQGKPVCFSNATIKSVRSRVKEALAELGYFFPMVEAKLIPDTNTKSAQLLVEIEDLGPKGIINAINITGNDKNTDNAILDLVDLHVGNKCTKNLLTRAWYRLWRSARFLACDVQPYRTTNNEFEVNIKVTEYEDAPALTKTLTPAEQAVLKLRDYLADWSAWQGDLVFSGSLLTMGIQIESFKIVISPQQGILFALQDRTITQQAQKYAGVWSQDRIALYSTSGQQKLVLDGTTGQVLAQITAKAKPNPDSDLHFYLMPGIGFSAQPGEKGSSFLDIQLDPVFFLHILHTNGMQCSLRNGTVEITGPSSQINIDCETGRLEDAVFSQVFNMSFEPRAFDKLGQELEDSAKEYNIVSTKNRYVSSTATFLGKANIAQNVVRHVLGHDVTQPNASSIDLQGTLLGEMLTPLDDKLDNAMHENGNTFVANGIDNDMPPMLMAAYFTLWSSHTLFPYGSWPWSVARSYAYLFCGKPQLSSAELEYLSSSNEFGPILYYLWSCRTKKASKYTSLSAAKGLEQLSARDFQKDYRLVLEGDSASAMCFTRLADALRNLSDEDVAVLIHDVPEPYDRFMHDIIQALQANREVPILDALSPVLDNYWENKLRKHIKISLQKALN